MYNITLLYLQDMWQLAMDGQVQGIAFWAVVYAFVLCCYSFIYQYRIRRWPSTRGKLAQLSIETFGSAVNRSEQDYISNGLYHYRVEEKNYEGQRISPWVFVASHNAKFILKKQLSAIHRDAKGEVTVFYHPSNPKKSFLILPGKLGLCITASFGVIPAICYWSSYHL